MSDKPLLLTFIKTFTTRIWRSCIEGVMYCFSFYSLNFKFRSDNKTYFYAISTINLASQAFKNRSNLMFALVATEMNLYKL